MSYPAKWSFQNSHAFSIKASVRVYSTLSWLALVFNHGLINSLPPISGCRKIFSGAFAFIIQFLFQFDKVLARTVTDGQTCKVNAQQKHVPNQYKPKGLYVRFYLLVEMQIQF